MTQIALANAAFNKVLTFGNKNKNDFLFCISLI